MEISISGMKAALLAALFLIALGGALIHNHVHPNILWPFYIGLFDAIAVTAMFFFDKTKKYAFWLNTVIVILGIAYHATFSVTGTISDTMLAIADAAVGYACFALPATVAEKVKK